MIFETIRKILSQQLDINETDITMESLIVDDLGADSLDVVDLVMSLEDEFDQEIPDDAIEDMKSVGDIVHYIEESAQ